MFAGDITHFCHATCGRFATTVHAMAPISCGFEALAGEYLLGL
jgi:hypothetical protein